MWSLGDEQAFARVTTPETAPGDAWIGGISARDTRDDSSGLHGVWRGGMDLPGLRAAPSTEMVAGFPASGPRAWRRQGRAHGLQGRRADDMPRGQSGAFPRLLRRGAAVARRQRHRLGWNTRLA